MADEDVKIVIKQKGTIPVYTKTKVGVAEVHHDETLKGSGTINAPLGISDEVMEEIENAGKIDDVRVDGVSVVTDKIAEIDLTGKVDKTSEADKVYGTDSEGNQTTYDVDGFGKVDDVKVNGVSVVENKIANVTVPTKTSDITNDSGFITKDVNDLTNYTKTEDLADVALTGNYGDLENTPTNVSDFTNDANYQNATQVSNTVSGAITTHNTSNDAHSNLLTPITQDIDAIEEKIPAEASSSNQLADKAYVDSQIGDIDEWTTEQYTPTTTNFVVGQTYTVEEAFQRTASLFAGQQGEIDDIEAVIPAQATTQNQLADKNFVNATVATNSANFRGNWATWADVPTQANLYPEDYVGNRTPTNNDYMVVDDATGYGSEYDGSWRFLYVGDWATSGKSGWQAVYRIGTAFTQEQQAAIDSGITANMVDNYVDPNSTAATAYNARITAVETDKRDIINSANKVYATDANGANKNDLVYDKNATAETIAQRGTNGVLKVGTPVDNSDAATKKYVDDGLSTKVDKVNTANKVYGTDAQGNQTTYDKSDFQDKLTAGTGINIDPNTNVISSTTAESNFRGRFANYASVPTSSGGYAPDYRGIRTPSNNDYMVVSDASDYAPTTSFVSDGTYINYNIDGYKGTLKITDIPSYRIHIGEFNQFDIRCDQGQRLYVYCNLANTYKTSPSATTYVTTDSACINVDPSSSWSYSFYRDGGSYQGAWRFRYIGMWNTDGKSGWLPEYQIEDVLPEATDQVKGIAKLYTTTGSNTDGSMTQKSITDALDSKLTTTDEASKVYGTDENGDQTTYAAPSTGTYVLKCIDGVIQWVAE